ncbi:MAG: hypothetical protein NWP87_00005, partial [Winogradskyella sp.]|nr:hypothetical protein [Winogradskyella sp.]
SFENEYLILKNSNTPDAQLYWHDGDYFFIKEAKPIFKIYKNKKEQHTIEINYRGTCSKFIKTKDL